MTDRINGDYASDLRRRAEDLLSKRGSETLSADQATYGLVHELSVHQTELEMQNEELRYTHLQLQSAMEQAHEFFEFAPIGHLTLDSDSAVTKSNLTACTMLGQSRTEVVGHGFAPLLIPASRKVLRDHLREVFEGPRGRRDCEVSVESVAGRLSHIRVESVMQIDPVERVPYCVCHLTDVSLQRRAVDELTLTLATASDAFVLLDRDLMIVRVSATAADRLGLDDAVQRPFAEIVAPDDVASVTSKLRGRLPSDDPLELEFRVVCRDATVMQMTWTVVSNGSADRICLVARPGS